MIKIAGLTKRYGKEYVLRNISCTLEPNHVYGLVGANGCGKTTLMRCICGFTRPTAGSVEVNGKVIGKDLDFPLSTGIILETPSFLPQHSGLKNLLILTGVSKDTNKSVAAVAMKELGLDPLSKKPVNKYSLGMRQRLGIAQAIMEDPDILILDEPFNGLDKKGVEDIHALLKELKERGKIILLASHSVADIGQACDVVFEMDSGRLVFSKGGWCKDMEVAV